MSYIANAVDTLLKEKKKSAADLARSSGITEASISRIKGGQQTWISGDDLKRIAASLTPSRGETLNKIHARLLHAHLLDECQGPGAKYIHIELHTSPVPMILRDTNESKPVLPPKLQHNLDVIAANITTNRHVRDLVESVANICQHGSLPQAHS